MFVLKIKDLQASTLLGVYDWEKQAKRLVILNIELHISGANAGTSDDIKDAVDYAVVEEKILRHLESSSYSLLEKLVTDIGRLILSLDPRITKATVEADKPGALRMARSVSVCAEFIRNHS